MTAPAAATTVTWPKRIALAASAWAVAETLLLIGGMQPRALLIATIVAVIAIAIWLSVDVSTDVATVTWDSATAPTHVTGNDARVDVIRLRLVSSDPRGASTIRTHAALVELIDDRLLADHGIDRATDPDAAAKVLGDELAQFISAPESPRVIARPVELGRILTLIENL